MTLEATMRSLDEAMCPATAGAMALVRNLGISVGGSGTTRTDSGGDGEVAAVEWDRTKLPRDRQNERVGEPVRRSQKRWRIVSPSTRSRSPGRSWISTLTREVRVSRRSIPNARRSEPSLEWRIKPT